MTYVRAEHLTQQGGFSSLRSHSQWTYTWSFPYLFLLKSSFLLIFSSSFFFSILLSIGCHPRMYSNSVGLPGRLSENMMQLIRLHVKSDPEYYHLSDSIPEKRTTFCDLSLVFQTINRCWGPANLGHCGS